MLIYACLSLYKSYKDRYKMFAAMCNHNVRVRMILLHGKHPPASEVPEGFEQITIPSNTNVFTRGKYLRELLVAAPGSERTIVHDTFTAQMGLYLRNRWTFKKHKNVRNVLSLYFTTPAFFLKGHWRGMSEDSKTRLREWPHYVCKYIPSIFRENVSCHFSDMTTGNSEKIIDDIHKYYRMPLKRTKFISAEVDTHFYCPGPSVRKEMNLPHDKKVILYAGHYQRHKGFDILLKAFDIFARRHKNVLLVIVGDINDTGHRWFGELLDSLPSRSCIDIREKVSQHTLRDFYRSSDLFVTASYYEGSPRVVKEAMACGLPVVASKIEGNLAIDPGQESLVLVDDWQPQLYAAKFKKVIEDDSFRHQRIEAGLKVVQNLSLDAVAQKYLELYDSLF